MQPTLLWDLFCTVIDNHGDLGVCWRLSRQLRDAGQRVRLWVDDASALAWMAPQLGQGGEAGIEVLPWSQAQDTRGLGERPQADVWIEAFGCHIPEPFIAQGARARSQQPVWINLEYLSAEAWVERNHRLPSPVQSGPARGWIKHFFYPGFTPATGGLLREIGLLARLQAFDRQAWRIEHVPGLQPGAQLISLFCYEPPALALLLKETVNDHWLVPPGRPRAAMQQALRALPHALPWTALPYTDQDGFDQMLWASDFNLVRGEDSWVRALWAGRPFVWQIYPQKDLAHHAKLEAFLDWLQAPPSLRQFHQVWNGLQDGPPPPLNQHNLTRWSDCVQSARQRLLAQDDLLTQLLRHVLRT